MHKNTISLLRNILRMEGSDTFSKISFGRKSIILPRSQSEASSHNGDQSTTDRIPFLQLYLSLLEIVFVLCLLSYLLNQLLQHQHHEQ